MAGRKGSVTRRTVDQTRSLAASRLSESFGFSTNPREGEIKNTTMEVEISKIKVLPQVRRDIDEDFKSSEMEDLVNSIEANGLLNPITLRKDKKTNELILLAGHRRLNAFKKLERKTIPATILDLDENQAVFAQMSENLTRKDLSIPDIAHGIKLLTEMTNPATGHNYSQTDIAKLIGISGPAVHRYYRFNSVNPKVLEIYQSKTVVSLECLLIIDDILKINGEGLDEYLRAGNVSRAKLREFLADLKKPKPTSQEEVLFANDMIPKATICEVEPEIEREKQEVKTSQVPLPMPSSLKKEGEQDEDVRIWENEHYYRDREGHLYLADGKQVRSEVESLTTEGKNVRDNGLNDMPDFPIIDTNANGFTYCQIRVLCKMPNDTYVEGTLDIDQASHRDDKRDVTYLWVKLDKDDDVKQIDSRYVQITSVVNDENEFV